ncbi:DegT/DnrJ/EryC1/StrS family aminotransferase [Streptomyces alkaliphilus]|uniref:DegT/DnrJ/EryC1/StrS family aminotransferase n=1 Tax=Streptomyces alkaliphilus TaxID=1472722 RepID=UPI001180693C|nr:DegT/DnrJ/EryC1/StrS family aminotransferase [Streptomyces alkaliphilus]MQS05751.1 hypothetical protein [Streptomyces alkaliphilus]
MSTTDTRVEAALAELPRRLGQAAVEFTASGSAALEVALEVVEVGSGDEVIVPDIGCHSVAAAVVRRGAVPVFVGVGEELTLTPDAVAAACTDRVRAVIAPHQYGLPCDVPGIAAGVPRGVVVIEDVAQAWGSTVRGVPAGATGALAITSFGPSKPLSLGAGGALLGPAATVAGTVARGDVTDRALPRPPSPARFPAPLLEGLPSAMDDADRRLARRREVVDRFVRGPLAAHFRLPPLPPDSLASWTRLPLHPLSGTEARREALEAALEAELGPVQPMHRLPPSSLPMFRTSGKRVVTGGSGPVEPLLVRIGEIRDDDDQSAPVLRPLP